MIRSEDFYSVLNVRLKKNFFSITFIFLLSFALVCAVVHYYGENLHEVGNPRIFTLTLVLCSLLSVVGAWGQTLYIFNHHNKVLYFIKGGLICAVLFSMAEYLEQLGVENKKDIYFSYNIEKFNQDIYDFFIQFLFGIGMVGYAWFHAFIHEIEKDSGTYFFPFWGSTSCIMKKIRKTK